jgi:hypothetical protein
METSINLSATGLLLILVAASSLFVMLSLNHINYIVHGELYNFGLEFSYRWAMPYWIFSGIVFSFCWVNIALAIALTFYLLKKSRDKSSHVIPQNPVAEKERYKTFCEKSHQSTLGEYDRFAPVESRESRSDHEPKNEPSRMDTEQSEKVLQISIMEKPTDQEQKLPHSSRTNEPGDEATRSSD